MKTNDAATTRKSFILSSYVDTWSCVPTESSVQVNGAVSRSSGADLAALMREAAEIAMTDHIMKSLLTEDACVSQSHIDRAFGKILPSVSETVIILCVIVQRILQRNLLPRIAVGTKNFDCCAFASNKRDSNSVFCFPFPTNKKKRKD